ncbi:MAG: hypothetical protein IJE45_01440 [Bacilli bacterium]|nr:hypothetical protein [Bacilli bacterium]
MDKKIFMNGKNVLIFDEPIKVEAYLEDIDFFEVFDDKDCCLCTGGYAIIKQKRSYEENWVLSFERFDLDYELWRTTWLNDWNEGEEVLLVGFIKDFAEWKSHKDLEELIEHLKCLDK